MSVIDVALSEEDIRDAKRLFELISRAAELPGNEAQTTKADPNGRFSVANLSILIRDHRTKFFPPAMFGEPAWDLLLTIYLHDEKGEVLTVSQLATFAKTPVTTALRWIDYLDEKRLISRGRSSVDGRVSTITLSDYGRSQLHAYFADVHDRMASSGFGNE